MSSARRLAQPKQFHVSPDYANDDWPRCGMAPTIIKNEYLGWGENILYTYVLDINYVDHFHLLAIVTNF